MLCSSLSPCLFASTGDLSFYTVSPFYPLSLVLLPFPLIGFPFLRFLPNTSPASVHSLSWRATAVKIQLFQVFQVFPREIGIFLKFPAKSMIGLE